MKKSIIIIALCLVGAIAFVANGMCQETETKINAPAGAKVSVKVNNTICPVTGSPVDMQNPVTVEYNGKIYNLCCSMCPATFKSDPVKYSKIAEEQAKGVSK